MVQRHNMTQSARRPQTSLRELALSPADPAEVAVEKVLTRVTLLIPEFGIVQVQSADGRCLALTAGTAGVDLTALRIGQAIECTVTRDQAHVVEAQAFG